MLVLRLSDGRLDHSMYFFSKTFGGKFSNTSDNIEFESKNFSRSFQSIGYRKQNFEVTIKWHSNPRQKTEYND